jgi:hypothetical protein
MTPVFNESKPKQGEKQVMKNWYGNQSYRLNYVEESKTRENVRNANYRELMYQGEVTWKG